MDKDNDILAKINGKSGMTVPDGYFAEFAKNMAMNLPERESQNIAPAHRSTWQQVRPYVYLAAMFMGIWCMLKMFTLMGTPDTATGIDNNPTLISALNDDSFVEELYADESIDSYSLLEDLYDEGFDASDFTQSVSYK